MSKQVFEGTNYKIGEADAVTKTITVHNTWSDDYENPGADGSDMVVYYTIVPTGPTSVVTTEAARPSEDTYHPVGNTAGTVNGTMLLPRLGKFTLGGGWRARMGVKTGDLGAGATVVVAMGTRA